MTVSINGTTGITYPNGSTLITNVDMNYFYWGDIVLNGSGVTIQNVKVDGTLGVRIGKNGFYDAVAPSRALVSFASSNGTVPFNIAIPAGVTENHTIFLYILYEEPTANRPSILRFTEVASRNTTLVGTSATMVILRGTILAGTTVISIPNDATFNGAVVALVAVYGNQDLAVPHQFHDVPSLGTVVASGYSRAGRQISILVNLGDGGPTEVSDSWTSDVNFNQVFNYLAGNGALVGRGAQVCVAYETNATTSFTLSDVTSTPPGTGGTWASGITIGRIQR